MTLRKNVYIDCMYWEPLISGLSSDATAVDGADTTVTRFGMGPYTLEIRNEQACADIIPLRVVDGDCCNGIQIPNDNADNDGGEMGFGILNDTNQMHAFTIGTDPAFFFEVKLGVPDVSEYDVLGIGFRGDAAYADAVNTAAAYLAAYDDKAGFNVDNGDITIVSSLNAADTGPTDTTDDWADDEAHTLKVLVSSAGVTTFQIDGAAPSTTAAHTFDTGDVVIPYIIWCKDAANTDTPPIIEHIKLGYQ